MIIGLIIVIAVVGLDQGLKYLAKFLLENRTDGEVIWIPKTLTFSYVENTGAAWGMLEDKQILFFVITLVALVGFGYLFTKSDYRRKKVYSISIALLIAGTLGNAIDRLILGYVIDFIHIPFLTPILNVIGVPNFWFNIADLALTVGVVLLIIDLLFFESKRNKKENDDERIKSVYDGVANPRKKEDDSN